MKRLAWMLALIILWGCSDQPLNNPYPDSEAKKNIFYTSFQERPKTLDPARSYSSNEYQFIAQIYEPPLQYHYLKRPYQLTLLSAAEFPHVAYYDKQHKLLPQDADASLIASSVYTIKIKPGRYYQPHPAFDSRYHHIDEDFLDEHDINHLNDFEHTTTRELVADDYIYQIKRLAAPNVNSPIIGLMSGYIVGMDAFMKQLAKAYQAHDKNKFFDLRQYTLPGVKKIDRYTYQIEVKGKYPQFLYWLAMPFFAPMPWEADLFYNQDGMDDRNITLDWFPIGTGPYYLTDNNPNRNMILEKNPNFAGELYPSDGTQEDKDNGLLNDAGKALPFIDKAIYSLEKEAMPRWNKFIQGYYDSSGIGSDSFDQAIRIDNQGQPQLTPMMKARDIRLYTMVSSTDYYMGFNMLDPIIGGYSERARLLRQAISIAVDYEEYISIFLNGRGIVAQGPIPPGIFGYKEGLDGLNKKIFRYENGRIKRKRIETALALLKQAGYANGRDIKTGKSLILNFDVPTGSGPDDKARFDWMRKQFSKLGIQLNIRATQYNRFQQKMRNGHAQIFEWGWHADYPDPENFLFLLYGPNGKVRHHGENAANYANPEFDKRFDKMKTMANGPERQAIIDEMLAIAQKDAPWVWGFHPKVFILSHFWNRVSKPNELANNTLKYAKLDASLREDKRKAWNKPIFWPLLLLMGVIFISVIPVWRRYRQSQYQPKARLEHD